MPDRGGLGNPCDAHGDALPCEAPNCKKPSRFRRQLPRRARTDAAGEVYLMGFRGPTLPRSRAETELVCGQHLPDWQHGPVSFEEHG